MPTRPLMPVRRRYRIGVPGLLFLALVTVVGVAAGSRAGNLLVWVFSAMVAWILVSGVVSGAMLMGVRVRRLEPGAGSVGRPLQLRYAVTNTNWLWPIADLRVTESRVDPALATTSHAWLARCGTGQTVHAEGVLWPRRRGRIRLESTVASSRFPFGLMEKSVVSSQPREILVHPQVVPLTPIAFARLVRTGIGQGQRVADGRGGGDDFRGLRAYVPGDPSRHVAWKRSTMLEEPVVVERSTPAPRRLLLVLDATLATAEVSRLIEPGADARQREEDAITLCASLLSYAEREGWEVSLRIAGVPPDAAAPPSTSAFRRGAWHLDRLLGMLAAVDLDAPRIGGEKAGARTGSPASRSAEQDTVRGAVTIVVHPARAELSVGGPGAMHLTAQHLPEMRQP
jgi:uncharacterized protein (DUF58 family)